MSAYKRILFSVGLFATVFIINFGFGYHQMVSLAPPDGYSFPELPTVYGVYECCGTTPNTAYSKVSGVLINCGKPGIGMAGGSRFGTSDTACWLLELNGKEVSVDQKMLMVSGSTFFPSLVHEEPYVTKITEVASKKVFFERSDAELRNTWISESIRGNFITSGVLGCFAFLIVFLKLSKYL